MTLTKKEILLLTGFGPDEEITKEISEFCEIENIYPTELCSLRIGTSVSIRNRPIGSRPAVGEYLPKTEIAEITSTDGNYFGVNGGPAIFSGDDVDLRGTVIDNYKRFIRETMITFHI